MDSKKIWPGFIHRDYCIADWSEEERRIAFINVATRLVGRGPGSQIYRSTCWPHDTLARQKAMESSQSACALLAGGALCLLGLRHELFATGYHGRNDAMSRLETVARQHKAWQGPDAMPRLADIVIMGTDVPKSDPKRREKLSRWGSPGHAAIIIDSKLSNGKITLHSVDGGRKNVSEGSYTVVRKGSQIWLKSWTLRRIYGVIRIDGLKLEGNLVIPPLEDEPMD